MHDRRSILKAIGLAPAAIPLAGEALKASPSRQQAAGMLAKTARKFDPGYDDDYVKSEDSLNSRYMPSEEDLYKESVGWIQDRWEEFQNTLSGAGRRQWEQRYDPRRLDPDLIENRSFSLSARLRMQTERDWARHIDKERRSFWTYVESQTDPRRKRRHGANFSPDLVSRVFAFARDLTGVKENPSTFDRMQF